ncbi:hypothetical protein J6TS7_07500 [Paenibacillus dendritiformis]|nr:hypothetical protein J6TS7_07500 [Paenibacillus dendritiformis]
MPRPVPESMQMGWHNTMQIGIPLTATMRSKAPPGLALKLLACHAGSGGFLSETKENPNGEYDAVDHHWNFGDRYYHCIVRGIVYRAQEKARQTTRA